MGGEDKIKHFIPAAPERAGAGLEIPELLQPVAQYLQAEIEGNLEGIQSILEDYAKAREQIAMGESSSEDLIRDFLSRNYSTQNAEKLLAEIDEIVKAVMDPQKHENIMESRRHIKDNQLLLRQLAEKNYGPVLSYIEAQLEDIQTIEASLPIQSPSQELLAERQADKDELNTLIALLKAEIHP